MVILWWLKWIAIILVVWTMAGVIVALLLGLLIKRQKGRERRNNGWGPHPENGK